MEFQGLEDSSKRPEAGIRDYSGTALFQTALQAPPMTADRGYHLDLGKVAVVLRVQPNGKNLGILWKPPYSVDVTDTLKAVEDKLNIAVVNLWNNRLIADSARPECSPRDDKGSLQSWPDWMLSGSSSPTDRPSFFTIPQWKSDEERVPSGLLGPLLLRNLPSF